MSILAIFHLLFVPLFHISQSLRLFFMFGMFFPLFIRTLAPLHDSSPNRVFWLTVRVARLCQSSDKI